MKLNKTNENIQEQTCSLTFCLRLGAYNKNNQAEEKIKTSGVNAYQVAISIALHIGKVVLMSWKLAVVTLWSVCISYLKKNSRSICVPYLINTEYYRNEYWHFSLDKSFCENHNFHICYTYYILSIYALPMMLQRWTCEINRLYLKSEEFTWK